MDVLLKVRLLLIGLFLSSSNLAHATAQAHDGLSFNGEVYAILGLTAKLMSPGDFGMVSEFRSTDNWRGFVATYTVESGRLFLSEMTINGKDDVYKKINDVSPDLDSTRHCFTLDGKYQCTFKGVYKEINLPFNFTGKIRIGREFIYEYYVHLGYQKPSAFKFVYDLTFEDGFLVNTLDRSAEAKLIRGKFYRQINEINEPLDQVDQKKINNDVREAYSFDMDELK